MTRLLVYESQPRNAAELARLADVELSEVRSLTQLRSSAAERRPHIVAIEVRENEIPLILRMLFDLKQAANSLVIVMPVPAVRVVDVVFYEAGADFVFRTMLDRPRIESLFRRKTRQVDLDPNDMGLRDSVWRRLPWKRFAQGGSG